MNGSLSDQIGDVFQHSHFRELKTFPAVSAGVQSRDNLILEDFVKNWEMLLGLTGDLRDKEKKRIRKALTEINIVSMVQANPEFHGIFNICLLRSRVKDLVYIIFSFSCGRSLIYKVKKKDTTGWGERILFASKEGMFLEISTERGFALPNGPNWMSYSYTFPLQCVDCSINSNVDR